MAAAIRCSIPKNGRWRRSWRFCRPWPKEGKRDVVFESESEKKTKPTPNPSQEGRGQRVSLVQRKPQQSRDPRAGVPLLGGVRGGFPEHHKRRNLKKCRQ